MQGVSKRRNMESGRAAVACERAISRVLDDVDNECAPARRAGEPLGEFVRDVRGDAEVYGLEVREARVRGGAERGVKLAKRSRVYAVQCACGADVVGECAELGRSDARKECEHLGDVVCADLGDV